MSGSGPSGDAEEGFGAVADAFAAMLADGPDAGAAAVAVTVGGRTVVDLWGGADPVSGRTMQRDSVMLVASCSKGVTATVLAMLVERGAIDPDALVSDLWPEYATNGKEETTIAMVASHRAGLPFPPLGSGLTGLDHHRGPGLLAALAAARPLWRPGSAMAYHSVTYGALLGEIIRRATGIGIERHVRTLIAEPLGVDLGFGLPEADLPRLVPGRWTVDPYAATRASQPEPGSYADVRQRALQESPPVDPDWDDPASVAAVTGTVLPAVNAVTNARALARMYGATIGDVDGVRLYGEDTRRRVTTPLTDDVPALVETGTTGPDIRFGLGYQLSSGSMPGFGPTTFGHTGAGGRLGIADPSRQASFGFVCSRMGVIGPDGDPRWTALLTAVDDALR